MSVEALSSQQFSLSQTSTNVSSSTGMDQASEEMVRRLSPDEIKVLKVQLEKCDDKNVNTLVAAFKEGNWAESDKCPTTFADMPYCALAAFRKGFITDLELGTLLLYWAASQASKEIKMFSFEKSEELLKKYFVEKGPFDLSEEQFGIFLKEIKNLPKNEQQCFLLCNEFVDNFSYSLWRQEFPLTRFCRFLSTADTLIPTMGIWQTYLHVKYGKNAVKVHPVLGYSSGKDIRNNGLHDECDCALQFPGVVLPEKVHGNPAPFHKISVHDLYHSACASRFPSWSRREVVKLSDLTRSVRKTHQQESDEYKMLDKCAKRLIEMEFLHSKKADVYVSDALWSSLFFRGEIRPLLDFSFGQEVMKRFCIHLRDTKSQLNPPNPDPNSEVHKLYYYICDDKRIPVITRIWQECFSSD